jgi:ADP-ribose pyrophosphatase YjhB (NUDIX family)
MQLRVIASAVIEKDDKVLLARKPKDALPYPNTWHLPGGGVEADETLEEAVQREVREEAGIEICDLRPLPFDEGFTLSKHGMMHYIFLVFLAKYESGELRSGDDIATLQWIDREDIPKMAEEKLLSEPLIQLLRSLSWVDGQFEYAGSRV